MSMSNKQKIKAIDDAIFDFENHKIVLEKLYNKNINTGNKNEVERETFIQDLKMDILRRLRNLLDEKYKLGGSPKKSKFVQINKSLKDKEIDDISESKKKERQKVIRQLKKYYQDVLDQKFGF